MKAVFFDIGGVVLNDHRLRDRVFSYFKGVSQEELWLAMNEEFQPACEGKQALSESWRAIASRLGIELSDDILNSLWIEGYEELVEVDQEVYNIIEALRGNYRLVVVSNTIAEHASIARKMGIYDSFDQVILSHEVGITKDNPRIFEIALEKVCLAAKDVAFVDDVEKYANVAASLGIEPLVFKNAKLLQQNLVELGFMF